MTKSKLNELVARIDVQEKFTALLGGKTASFISSLLQIANGNAKLLEADPITILNAAATAAALDLPINPNLGFAWIVPYRGQGQFQMGWKGYVQLAHRTQQYNKINVVAVHESQFKSYNAITEYLEADWTMPESGKVVGYAAYFRLLNGFDKFVYWTREKVEKHGKRYSQSFANSASSWQTNFDEMAMKTVLKNTLSKWGPLSVEMQTAILADQSIQLEPGKYDYIDNKSESIDKDATSQKKEHDRILSHIEQSTTLEQLERVAEKVKDIEALQLCYNAKKLKIEKGNEIKK